MLKLPHTEAFVEADESEWQARGTDYYWTCIMKIVWCALVVALPVSLSACGSNTPSSSAPARAPEPISGGESLEWDQAASSPEELAKLRYAIYVDGVRSELPDVSCSPKGTAYACRGRLPAMAPGTHRIEIATFALDGSNVIEGPRAPAFTVTVGGPPSGGDR